MRKGIIRRWQKTIFCKLPKNTPYYYEKLESGCICQYISNWETDDYAPYHYIIKLFKRNPKCNHQKGQQIVATRIDSKGPVYY